MYIKPLIFNISRTSLHDGPGVRSVVYFKGCNMRCAWCHNPEGIEPGRSIVYNKNKCIHCGRCLRVCENISASDNIEIDRQVCKKCGRCTKVCPSGALSVAGMEMTADEIMEEVLKDKPYYERTGGGVTLSGGECLLFADFAAEVLQKCKENQVHTLIESAMNVPWENVERVLAYTDSFFVDIKQMDPMIHKKFTGTDNFLILENIRRLSGIHNDITIRIPVIPSVNDSEENLKQTEDFAKECGIKKVERLTYNNLAASKYEALGKEYIEF